MMLLQNRYENCTKTAWETGCEPNRDDRCTRHPRRWDLAQADILFSGYRYLLVAVNVREEGSIGCSN